MVQERDKPKRKTKKANQPEPVPHLTDAEMEKIDEIADDALFLTREEQAAVHLSMEESREKAAGRLGWTMKQLLDCLKQPHVKLYAMEYREIFMKRLARSRAESLKRVGVNPTAVLERTMQLAQMDPSETNRRIDGQVKALTLLASVLGMTQKDDPLKNKTEEELMEIVNGTRAKAAGQKPPAVQ